MLRLAPQGSRNTGLFQKILAEGQYRGTGLVRLMNGIRRLEWNPWTELDMGSMEEDYDEDEYSDASDSDGGGGSRWGAQALKDYAVHLSALEAARLDELIVVGMNSELAEGVLDDFLAVLPNVQSEL